MGDMLVQKEGPSWGHVVKSEAGVSITRPLAASTGLLLLEQLLTRKFLGIRRRGPLQGVLNRDLQQYSCDTPYIGFGKRCLLEKGSFQKSPFSRDSRDFRDFRESPDCGKQSRIGPFSRDSREFRDFRDSRDSSSEKTPFVMTPFSGPDCSAIGARRQLELRY